MALRTEDTKDHSDTAARIQREFDDVSRELAITQIAVEHLKSELETLDPGATPAGPSRLDRVKACKNLGEV